MIFLSLGTTKQPFMRAVDLMAPFVAAGERVLVQYGCTEPDRSRPGLEWVEFLDYEEMNAAIRESRAFICHAGVGSVITAMAQSAMPIVIPREARFGEHIDDHQLELAGKLEQRGLAVVLHHGDGDVEAAAARAAGERMPAKERGAALAQAVIGLVGPAPR